MLYSIAEPGEHIPSMVGGAHDEQISNKVRQTFDILTLRKNTSSTRAFVLINSPNGLTDGNIAIVMHVLFLALYG